MVSGEMQSRAKELVKQQQNLFNQDKTDYRTKTVEACEAASERY